MEETDWDEMIGSEGITLAEVEFLEFYYYSLFTTTAELEKIANRFHTNIYDKFNGSPFEYFLKVSDEMREWYRYGMAVTDGNEMQVIELNEDQLKYLESLQSTQLDLKAFIEERGFDDVEKYNRLSIEDRYWIDILEGITEIVINQE